jgi:hypothetical protein
MLKHILKLLKHILNREANSHRAHTNEVLCVYTGEGLCAYRYIQERERLAYSYIGCMYAARRMQPYGYIVYRYIQKRERLVYRYIGCIYAARRMKRYG